MITEKQFLEACDIVKKYHAQIGKISEETLHPKTLLSDWLKKHDNLSFRLSSALTCIAKGYVDFVPGISAPFYIKDITPERLGKLRNIGKKSIAEFNEIRQKEINNLI